MISNRCRKTTYRRPSNQTLSQFQKNSSYEREDIFLGPNILEDVDDGWVLVSSPETEFNLLLDQGKYSHTPQYFYDRPLTGFPRYLQSPVSTESHFLESSVLVLPYIPGPCFHEFYRGATVACKSLIAFLIHNSLP